MKVTTAAIHRAFGALKNFCRATSPLTSHYADITARGDRLDILAGDKSSGVFIASSILGEGDGREKWGVSLPIDRLVAVGKENPDGICDWQGETMRIESPFPGRVEYRFVSCSQFGGGLPEHDGTGEVLRGEIPRLEFCTALATAQKFIGSERWSGAFLHRDLMVATDGGTLFLTRIPGLDAGEDALVIPKPAIKVVLAVMKSVDAPGPIRLYSHPTGCVLRLPGSGGETSVIVLRDRCGVIPPYQRVSGLVTFKFGYASPKALAQVCRTTIKGWDPDKGAPRLGVMFKSGDPSFEITPSGGIGTARKLPADVGPVFWAPSALLDGLAPFMLEDRILVSCPCVEFINGGMPLHFDLCDTTTIIASLKTTPVKDY